MTGSDDGECMVGMIGIVHVDVEPFFFGPFFVGPFFFGPFFFGLIFLTHCCFLLLLNNCCFFGHGDLNQVWCGCGAVRICPTPPPTTTWKKGKKPCFKRWNKLVSSAPRIHVFEYRLISGYFSRWSLWSLRSLFSLCSLCFRFYFWFGTIERFRWDRQRRDIKGGCRSGRHPEEKEQEENHQQLQQPFQTSRTGADVDRLERGAW
jgi:hypothetical protein